MGNCLLRSTSNDTTPGTSNIDYSSATTNTSVSKRQLSGAVSNGYEESNPVGQIVESPNLKVFTFADLKRATKNFKADNLLGGGRYGWVCKGWIDERTLAPSKSGFGIFVAIKAFNMGSIPGNESWQSEVNFMGSISHPNIVKLLGYCWEEELLLLVYEFMQKGSLENCLFRGKPDIKPLSWDLRLKIAIGAATGLAFLHTSEKQVIYRDVRTSNILLDTNYNAKLSDFRLARAGPSAGDTHVTTSQMATYGYAAPEYGETGLISVKSDVYGFGVVLLEMMTGLRAFDIDRPWGQQHLVDRLKPILSRKRKLRNVMDKTMEGQYSFLAMLLVAKLASKCVEKFPKNRPSMKEVLEVLKQIHDIKETGTEARGGRGQRPPPFAGKHLGVPLPLRARPRGSRRSLSPAMKDERRS